MGDLQYHSLSRRRKAHRQPTGHAYGDRAGFRKGSEVGGTLAKRAAAFYVTHDQEGRIARVEIMIDDASVPI